MTIRRAAQHHDVMTAITPKPKPKKAKKAKRTLPKPRRKILEKQVEAMVKQIIAWRDGQVCVMGSIDGARCQNGLMWNHLIAQGQSSWLKFDLGNVFWGCGNHNLLDKLGDKVLAEWFVNTFGAKCLTALRVEATKAKNEKRTRKTFELEEMLAHYDELYQDRYFVEMDTQSLIRAGYYGEVIREALGKDNE
jgi:hypothetical protein